jgi:hypothetical protein
MKKTTTIIAGILFAVGLSAQIIPGQNHNGFLKAKNDKITMSGDEALSHLMINPNPHTSAVLNSSKSTITEEIIGTSTYDLQSNACVQNRILHHDDGTISAGWTMSTEYNTTFADRGTGYNFFDGTTWGAQPTIRLESSRGGWPSILKMGSGKEASITHNTDNSYVNMTHRATTGSGTWTEQNISSQDSNGVYRDMIWNRSAVGGLNNETVHMIAVTASSAFAGAPFNGLDGALVYYRSQDEGVTWDRKDIQLPGMDTSMFTGMSGDVYAITAQGETVVVAYFDDWGDSFIVKSIDNGDTWTKTTFLDFPVDKYIADDGFDLDDNDTTDHVFSSDNNGAVILDANGQAHIFYGVMQYSDDDLADAGTSWYPGTNMLAYWNESYGADNHLDSTQNQSPTFTVDGDTIGSVHYSLDTVWINYDNTQASNYYMIIQYNNSLSPLTPTDTIWAWESNVYSYDYDSLANVIDSIFIIADSTLVLSYNTWYSTTLIPNSISLQDTVGYIDAAGVVTPRGRWWSDMMNDHIITAAPDLNNDGFVDGIDSTGGYALYYNSRASMPNAGISANGEIYLSFSGYTETADNGSQVFRHIYITKSSDGGSTWKDPVDVTPHDMWNGMQECVFASMNPVIDDKIRIVYQKDFEPGLAVRGDEDMVDNNEIIYLEIDTVGLFGTSVSVNDIKNTTQFTVYPNPANDYTSIAISLDKTEKVILTIVDLLGKEISKEEKVLFSGKTTERLDVSNFQNGVYFINLQVGNKITTQKLVITK